MIDRDMFQYLTFFLKALFITWAPFKGFNMNIFVHNNLAK